MVLLPSVRTHLEFSEASLPEHVSHCIDQSVILTVAIILKDSEDFVDQTLRRNLCQRGDAAGIVTSGMKTSISEPLPSWVRSNIG